MLVAALLAAAPAVLAAPESDRVTSLPLYTGNASFAQYSGYLNAGGSKRLHYWLTEASQVDPATAPLLLWLNVRSCPTWCTWRNTV